MEEEDRPPSNLSSRAEELVTTALERAHRAVTHDIDNQMKTSTSPKQDTPQTWVWPSRGDFEVELGRGQISEYIANTWDVDPRWLFRVDHLETTAEEEEDHRRVLLHLHRYRARWSIPTRRSPIPRETASVYFLVRVSRLGRQNEPVEVRYVVESTTLEHPSTRRFREKWLTDVVESKALLRRAVDF